MAAMSIAPAGVEAYADWVAVRRLLGGSNPNLNCHFFAAEKLGHYRGIGNALHGLLRP